MFSKEISDWIRSLLCFVFLAVKFPISDRSMDRRTPRIDRLGTTANVSHTIERAMTQPPAAATSAAVYCLLLLLLAMIKLSSHLLSLPSFAIMTLSRRGPTHAQQSKQRKVQTNKTNLKHTATSNSMEHHPTSKSASKHSQPASNAGRAERSEQ